MSQVSNNSIRIIDRCPIQGIIDIISKKWALLVVAVLGNYSAIRYNDIMNELSGISPKSLADTLKQLHDSGIVDRRSFNEIPPRVEYSLTKDGERLREAIIPIINWVVDRSTRKDCVILQSVLKRKPVRSTTNLTS